MDVKFGFTDNPRELVINAKGEKDAVVQQIQAALSSSGEDVLALEDAKGRTHLLRTAAIAYVEVGTEAPRPVGFA